MRLVGAQEAIVHQPRAHVVLPLLAQFADAAGQGRLHDDSVTHVQMMDTATDFLHESRGIVTQGHGFYVATAVLVHMDV